MVVTRWDPVTFRSEGYGRRYLWIDLVNSEYADGFGLVTDYLRSDSWRKALLEVWTLPPAYRAAFPMGSFRALRTLLRAAAEEIAKKGVLSSSILGGINAALAPRAGRWIERAGRSYRVVLQPGHAGWPWVKAEVAASFGEFLSTGKQQRLKVCPNPGCRWLFYDETRGCTKRWCNDRLCGNRDKVRRHRSKLRR